LSDETGFLRTILAYPEDDAGTTFYADRLEEHGSQHCQGAPWNFCQSLASHAGSSGARSFFGARMG
jgi:uncharacterized protein (TIGR02996 family)